MRAPVTVSNPLTTIRRRRVLPVPGKVLVRKGQSISENDVIAQGNLSPEHIVLDIANGLGIHKDEAKKQIISKIGSRVVEGDMLAGPVGMTKRVVRAPCDGQVVLISGHMLVLEKLSHPITVRAGLAGQVIELVEARGAVIETSGVLIQGAWGNGHIASGSLHCLSSDTNQLRSQAKDRRLKHGIIYIDHCDRHATLHALARLPVRGLFIFSLAADLVPAVSVLPIPVMVLVGFGRIEADKETVDLLNKHNGEIITINAEARDRINGARPEAVIPLPGNDEVKTPPEIVRFARYQKVRAVSAPYFGKIGHIEGIEGATVLPNGVRAPTALILLDNGEKTRIPLTNLEAVA